MALITDDQITRLSSYKETRENVEPGTSITGIEFYWIPAAILDDLIDLAESFHSLSFDYDAIHRELHEVLDAANENEKELQAAFIKLAKVAIVANAQAQVNAPGHKSLIQVLTNQI